MIDICRRYGIHVDRGGFTRCPFHGEKTASMKVYGGAHGYHCFGCHHGGDVLDFVGKYFGLDFQQTIRKINSDFGLNLPVDGNADREAERKARREAYQRRKAEERRKKRLVSLQKARDEALGEYAKLDRAAQNLANEASLTGLEAISGPDVYNVILDGISNQTAYSVTHLDDAWYRFCEADLNLRSFEKDEQNKNDWR